MGLPVQGKDVKLNKDIDVKNYAMLDIEMDVLRKEKKG